MLERLNVRDTASPEHEFNALFMTESSVEPEDRRNLKPNMGKKVISNTSSAKNFNNVFKLNLNTIKNVA